jgi:2-polyprenyl-3-methyl-5-hydroxy-6-metoxy-1,4-benzoquinol methylase
MSDADVNREYYESLQPGRDDYWTYMAAPRRRVSVILRELRRLGNVGSVVDLGCGNGALLSEVASAFPATDLTGIDLSSRQIAENRRAFPALRWHDADLQATVEDSFSARFDVALSSEVIEHLQDPGMLLRNAHRVIRDRGHLILSTQSGRVGETERRVGHLRHFTREEMSELLTASGWEPIRVWNEGFPFHDLSKSVANLRPDAAMQSFGESRYGPVQRAVCAALRGAFLLNSRSRGAQLFAVARRVA